MATQWHYQTGGEELGPVSFRELIELVRSGTVTESDLVRSSWKPDWQRADSVVGLFHMAGRSADDLARLDTAAGPAMSDAPPPEPVLADAAAEITTSPAEESVERPGWMKRLFSLSGFRQGPPAEIQMLGPRPVESSAATTAGDAGPAAANARPAESLAPELAGFVSADSNSADSPWSSAVGEALDHIEQRAGAVRPAVGRWGRLTQRVARVFATARGAGQSSWARPAFRLVCAIVCANLVAFAVESWSAEEALRFPVSKTALGQDADARHFPFLGKCGPGEYLFLTFDLMLVTGAAAWFAARWLDSHAE